MLSDLADLRLAGVKHPLSMASSTTSFTKIWCRPSLHNAGGWAAGAADGQQGPSFTRCRWRLARLHHPHHHIFFDVNDNSCIPSMMQSGNIAWR